MSAEEEARYAYELAESRDTTEAIQHLDTTLRGLENSIAALMGNSSNEYLVQALTSVQTMRQFIDGDDFGANLIGYDVAWREKLNDFAGWLMGGG